MYRVLGTLHAGKGRLLAAGSFSDLAWLNEEQQERLLELGKVSVVKPPPLAILPGWKRRAERFAASGIVTIVDFLEADEKELVEQLAKTGRPYKEATIRRWKRDAKDWLIVKPQTGG
jgi:hypothetical protein